MPPAYVALLADRRIRGLATGNLVSSVGDGMAAVAVPWLALQLAHAQHASEGLAVAGAATAGSLLGVPLALAVGLGRRRFDPRAALLADCAVRGTLFLLAAALAAGGRLPLWWFIGLLGAASALHTVAMSGRRLILTDLAGPERRLAVNSLITPQFSVATWTVGPALGGLLGGAGTLGAVWTGFGVGAIAGSFLVGTLGRVPQRLVLLGATGGWAVALAAFTASRSPAPAGAAVAPGGMLGGAVSP